MRRLLVVAATLALSACAGERHYALEGPPPPMHTREPVAHGSSSHATPVHPAETPPSNVGSAGPLKLAMVGSYMDAQERDFRTRLHSAGVGVARIGDDLVLSLRNDALFDEDGLSSRGGDVLERMAELLRHYDHTAVQIGGYTDTAGAAAQNVALSQRRAKTVADALVSDGVPAARVSAQGYGAMHLKIATGPDKAEPRNRRIEIRVTARPAA